jgi:hypothetical protein
MMMICPLCPAAKAWTANVGWSFVVWLEHADASPRCPLLLPDVLIGDTAHLLGAAAHHGAAAGADPHAESSAAGPGGGGHVGPDR